MGNCALRLSHISPPNSRKTSALYQRILSDIDPSLLSDILALPGWTAVRLGQVLPN
jgi:hypothetical protein